MGLLVIAGALGVSTRATSTAEGLSQIIARPRLGHAGDAVFLAFSGFQPGKQLSLFMGCPDITDPRAIQNHNTVFQLGPVPDSQGNYAGFKLAPLTIRGLQPGQDSVPCRIYTVGQYGTGQFGPDLPGTYTVYAPGAPLPPGSYAIRGSINARPKRVRTGLAENIAIDSGWGGALATVTVTYPHSKPLVIRKSQKLNWKGEGSIRIRVGPATLQPGRVTIRVHFQLGPYHGDTHSSFVVDKS